VLEIIHPRARQSQHLLALCMLLVIAPSQGCVTIRDVGPVQVSNCRQSNSGSMAGDPCCQLYDRGEVAKQWASKMNPVKLVPPAMVDWVCQCKHGTAGWFSNQCARCAARKASIHGWFHKKREEANAPPWPRFHPVPTKPVFEPEEIAEQAAPQVYGRFGEN